MRFHLPVARLTLVLGIFTVAAGAALTAALPAHAGIADMTCTPPSSTNVSFSPALTDAPQSVTVTPNTDYGPCVSLGHPSVTSGSADGVATHTLSCADLLSSGPVGDTITWNTGQTTSYSGTRVSTIEGALVVNTVTGTITSGLFAGDSFVLIETGPATSILECELGLGTVSSLNETVALEITST
jgi:hypothetical protein